MRLDGFFSPKINSKNHQVKASWVLGSRPQDLSSTQPSESSYKLTSFSDNPAYVQMANQRNHTRISEQLSLETVVIKSEFPSNHHILSSILEKILTSNSENHYNSEIKNIFQKIKNEVNISIIDTNTLNAFADKGSNTIYISKGLINAVLNNHEYHNSANHELAFIIGHELSHLVYEQHIKKQNSNNAMSQSEEYFCDRLALELCDNTGFDIKYAKFDTIKQKDQVSVGFLSSHPHSFDREFILNELRQSQYWKNLETLIPQRVSPLQEYESTRKSPLDKLLNSPASLNSRQNHEEILLNSARLLLSMQNDETKFQLYLKKIIENSTLSECEQSIYLESLSRLHPKHRLTKSEEKNFNIHELSKAAFNLPKLPEYLKVLNAIHDNSAAVSSLNQCFKHIYSNMKWHILNVEIKSDKESEKLLECLNNDSLLLKFDHHDRRSLINKLNEQHMLKLIREDLSSENNLQTFPYDDLNSEQESSIRKTFNNDISFRELLLKEPNDYLLRCIQEDISIEEIKNLKFQDILTIVCMKDLNKQDLNIIKISIPEDELTKYMETSRPTATGIVALLKLFKDDIGFIDELSKSTIKAGYGLMDTNDDEDFNLIKTAQRQFYENLNLKEFYELIKETDSRSSGEARNNISEICLKKICQKYTVKATSEAELEESLELILNLKEADLQINNNSKLDFHELDKEELLYLSRLMNSSKITLTVLAIALENELENFSRESFLDFIKDFDLQKNFAGYYRDIVQIDKSQEKIKISDTYPFDDYTLLDSALIKILDKQKLNTNEASEIFNFICEVFNKKSLERDFFLNRYVKIEELKELDSQINFVNSFSNEHLAFEQRMFLFNQELPKCKSLTDNIELINEIFPKASKEKDILLNSAFNEHGLKFSEFKKYRQLFTHDDPQYEESRSLISGSLKSLLISEDAQERITILNWLTEFSDLKPTSIERYEEKNHVNADELKLLLLNKALRLEILNSLCIGTSSETLFHEDNQSLMNDFLKKLVDSSLINAESAARDEKLEILCKATLCELFKISNQNKKLNILNNLIELGIVNQDASIGKLICGFLGNLGAVGVKFGQTLASNKYIESKYPDLHEELSKLKENFSPMGIEQAMIAIEQNPILHDKDIRIIKPLAAASLKGVFLIEFEGKEAILKVFRPEINKNLDQEKTEFSLLLEKLNPTIKDLFEINRIPNYAESVFKALKEEISIEKEISNNLILSRILSSYSNEDFSLNTTKNFPFDNQRFIIIEELAPGQSYESLRKDLSDEEIKKNLDNLQNLCFIKSSLEAGFYHADPHRGNIFIKLEDENPTQVTFIDSGLCGKLPENLLNKPYIKEIMNIINQTQRDDLWSNMKNIPNLIKSLMAIREDFPELKVIKPLHLLSLIKELKESKANPALTIANWLELYSDSDQLNRFFMTMAKLDTKLIIENINLIKNPQTHSPTKPSP